MRYVIKNGSSSVYNDQIRSDVLLNIAKEAASLVSNGYEVAHVSSGAIALGVSVLHADPKTTFTIPEHQAFAAVGQVPLIEQWAKAYREFNLDVGQVLVTNEVLKDKLNEQKSHLSDTFDSLFELGVIPIINENDAVAIAEIVQGDNDNLSALIANMIEAKILVLVGDIDAVYFDFPTNTKRIKTANLDQMEMLEGVCVDTDDSRGTGGMKTKLQAANIFLRNSNLDNSKVVYIVNSSAKSFIAEAESGKIGTMLTLKPL